jgi:hypothetical protein
MKKQPIELSETEKEEIEQLIAKGELPARLFKRANKPVARNRGETLEAVASLKGL